MTLKPGISLTPTQSRVIQEVCSAIEAERRLLVLWYGGIRAGKSTGAALAMLLHSTKRKGETYMIAAHTQRQAVNIFMPAFQHWAEVYGLKYRQVKGSSPYMEIEGNMFLIIGGADAGRDRTIQGLTLSGLILDEIPNLNSEFIAQAEARVSGNSALRIYTANKTSPYHWTTIRYYNRALAGEIDALLVDSETADNQFIGRDFIQEKEREYDSLHYDRFIANQFRLDLEPIYAPHYKMADGEHKCAVSALYGGAGLVSAVQAAESKEGYFITDCWKHKITELPSLGNTVLINSERPYLARRLRRAGHRVIAYNGDYLPRRVEITQTALSEKRIVINGGLTELTQAIDEYSIAGMYSSDYIKAIEALGEFTIRRNNALP